MRPLETRFAHAFVDGEDQYLFVRVLGMGMEASAQLVVHAQTGELLVRKVNKCLLDEREKEKDDPEKILFLVQSQARSQGLQPPNLAHLCSAGEVPAPPRRGGQELLYHRVKYFRFYNGGNLDDFRCACQVRGLAPPPALICKMIRELAHALSFMYSMRPYVLHGDAHSDNIFLHWEQEVSGCPSFFLGDFGRSTCGTTRAGNRRGLATDIFQVWSHTQELLGIWTNPGSQDTLRQYLEAVVEPELNRLAHGPPSLLPDLARLLELLSAAPASPRPDMRPLMLPGEPQNPPGPSPRFYDTWEEARRARGIHGPWHVAQLSVDPTSGKLNVDRISPWTYHRPSLASSDDSDSASDEWAEISPTESEDWTLVSRSST